MDQDRDDLDIVGLFRPEIDMPAVANQLEAGGVETERIAILSSLPLPHAAPGSTTGMLPYALTIGAGMVGIGVGVFFAAGTAALYPLKTGGKPIVAAPIVGIISYETMMLLAIVVTFLTLIVTIKRAQRGRLTRDVRVDDGMLALSVRLPHGDHRTSAVREALERAGATDVTLSSSSPAALPAKVPAGQALVALMLILVATSACSPDMEDQQSYRPQESPRLHSPSGSVPRQSRAVTLRNRANDSQGAGSGEELYRINCLHCHGAGGTGTGPVAALLREPPADLLSPEIRNKSADELYTIITHGKDMMPSFRGELSAEERYTVAQYVKSLPPQTAK